MAALARSLAYCASNFSIRVWETFAVLRSRAFSRDSDLIAAFWRRDLVDRQLRKRCSDRAELGNPGRQLLVGPLGHVQRKAQPEDLVRQRPNPVRLIEQPSQHRAQLNVLVVLSAYGLLAQLTAFRAQGFDRGLLILRPLQGRTQPASVLVRLCDRLRLADSMLASESSFSRRVTSACRERAFFAARRTSFASSTAAFSLLRQRSSCHFSEPARPRASASAQRSSSARASAVSAREHSRSARACACSYRDRQSRASRAGANAEDDKIPSSTSISVRFAPKSSSRLAMRGN